MKTKQGLIVLFIGIIVGSFFPKFAENIKSYLNEKEKKKAEIVKQRTTKKIFEQINPEKGYRINAFYGDLGPKMIEAGVIDLEKFKAAYEKNGQPLTKKQQEILTQGSKERITVTRENSYFLLNFFWAAGLANRSKILTEGQIARYGQNEIGNFASTGGWSLSKSKPMDYYAQSDLIVLTADEEELVDKVAGQIFRPCCDNSTAFPDCNHGMALLAVLQLMAANGATEKQLFEAAKYFNAFWFPGNYYDLALYFKNKEKKDFSQIPGEVILGREYSSASGWQGVKKWLADRGIIEQPPASGGSCGV